MTAPDHLRITGPEDILGFIPHSLGYWPENSLVAMTLQGKRLGATLRVDLPVPGGGSGRSDMLAGFARNVVAYLQADDAADGSLLAFFTDADADADTETDSAGDGHAWADLLKELELALEAAGLPLRDAWIIGTEFWRNAHCSDPDCCGMPGRPVEQIEITLCNQKRWRIFELRQEMRIKPLSEREIPCSELLNPGDFALCLRAVEELWRLSATPAGQVWNGIKRRRRVPETS